MHVNCMCGLLKLYNPVRIKMTMHKLHTYGGMPELPSGGDPRVVMARELEHPTDNPGLVQIELQVINVTFSAFLLPQSPLPVTLRNPTGSFW